MTKKQLPSYRYRIQLVRVIDGDTIVADIDLGFYARIRTNLRLYGINCPEINTPEGKEAKAFTLNSLTWRSPVLTAETIKADKYGNRWDAVVWLGDGTSLNQLLVDKGHAVHKVYSKESTNETN